MSEIVVYRDGFESDGTIVKMATLTSKGGNLVLSIQVPLDAEVAGVVTTHLNNIAKIAVRFSATPAKSIEDAEDKTQGKLALDALGGDEGGTADDEDLDEDTEATDEEAEDA
ncbi:hypothetical protein [Tetrasphaera phage TJE1]|uniref:Uncharacterized protein n=1 Tax=Tetrasphaera phage TJE1 TaxID=981335 RepID=G4W995_9CAUD|nr:hypothetical protein G185_gp63 [Tetrasphaera phage TJE1]ADX42583.1 hypothetical protein [Tetrasphaera phage TJE1]